MNIFVLDRDLKKSAQALVDKHLVKQILEHCQVLCSVHHFIGTENVPYKKTHINHPCSIWTRESLSNYLWLINYTQEMIFEYKFRYGKIHACQRVLDWCRENIPAIVDKGITPHAQAMPDQYRGRNTINAYRRYYLGEKTHLFAWKNRQVPRWAKNYALQSLYQSSRIARISAL